MAIKVARFEEPQRFDSYEQLSTLVHLFLLSALESEELLAGRALSLLATEKFQVEIATNDGGTDTTGRVIYSGEFDGQDPLALDPDGNVVEFEKTVAVQEEGSTGVERVLVVTREGDRFFLHAVVQYLKEI